MEKEKFEKGANEYERQVWMTIEKMGYSPFAVADTFFKAMNKAYNKGREDQRKKDVEIVLNFSGAYSSGTMDLIPKHIAKAIKESGDEGRCD